MAVCPSLLQLFDEENPVHRSGNRFMFTTEGHVVSVDGRFRSSLWEDILPAGEDSLRAKPSELRAANFSSNVSNTHRLGLGRGSQGTQSLWKGCCGEFPLEMSALRSSPEKHLQQQHKWHHVWDAGEGET